VKVLRLILESFSFALSALKGNLLRTFLSLLGVTIGIFAIISVFTIVDSLEKNIRTSMAFLGDNVIRVEKWPWVFEEKYPWWKFLNRPHPSVLEYKVLSENLKRHAGLTFFSEKHGVMVKSKNNSIGGINLTGVSTGYEQVFDVPVAYGRYLSFQEIESGRPVVVIGANVKEALFPFEDPLGKTISIRGLHFKIIGVMEPQGENIVDAPSKDDFCVLPLVSLSKLYQVGGIHGLGTTIAAKAQYDDVGQFVLEGELRNQMRSLRGLKPIQDDNFALNRPEMIADLVGSTFAVITLAGWVIGGFSILVGGFGIANIMFVSVKERTNLIGIQKSLGAKNYFILSQFLFEAVCLSLIGGLAGIVLVYMATLVPLGSLEVVLTLSNVLVGLLVSGIIGTIAGFVPAMIASKLDPVIAIRS
jgi:putative ABC transport system permease protein